MQVSTIVKGASGEIFPTVPRPVNPPFIRAPDADRTVGWRANRGGLTMDEAYFARPYTDVDEWRDEPVRHRFVSGGFEGTETRFSYYFPPAEQYGSRMIHHIEGGGGGSAEAHWSPSDPLASDLANALAAGAYFVVSNQGHDGPDANHLDRWIHHYGANVAVASHSRDVAASVYGEPPQHGYIYGGSGGAARTLVCLENAPAGLYDGAVVFILPHVAQQVLCAYVAETARVLDGALDRVVDATAPGGSGDPYDDLGSEQRETLATLYRLGFPRGAEDQIHPVTTASNGVIPGLRDLDPTYFEEFWTEPGYAGHDGSAGSSRIQRSFSVARTLGAAEIMAQPEITQVMDVYQYLAVAKIARDRPEAAIGVVLEGLSAGEAVGAELTVRTGASAGRTLLSLGGGGEVIIAGGGRRNMSFGFEDVVAGDEVFVDNSDFLAYANFTRHQNEDIPQFDVFRTDDTPVFPQRPRVTGTDELYFVAPYTGAVDQKVIVLQNTHDAQCWPCAPDHLRKLMIEQRGTDGGVRVWFNENAMHLTGPQVVEGPVPVRSTRFVDYRGHVHQALRDTIAWVEAGTEPPPDTAVEWSTDGALGLPSTAAERRGIQPVVSAAIDGRDRADVRVGDAVTIEAHAATPPGCGTIVDIEWDVDGTGTFAFREHGIDGSRAEMHATRTVTYETPGVHFPCVRVSAHRDGDVESPQRRIINLARVRVVVTA